MKNKIDRRSFIKGSAALGVLTAAGSSLLSQILTSETVPGAIDISVVQGNDYFLNAVKAVDLLGGMNKYVHKGSTVGMLINSVWDHPGTYTSPDVSLAVVKMCLDSGAKAIYSIEGAPSAYWKRSKLCDKFKEEIKNLKNDDEKKKVKIEKGKSLKQAEISKALLECDVLINVPIVKHHQGTNFTATLKNMMGACNHSTNRFFHQGSGAKGGYDDVPFLSQCIADVNLVRQPDLYLVDATEFVTTGGPAGPGDLKKPGKVIAAKNRVSVDAYCSTLLGYRPEDVLMIKYAYDHGMGEINLAKLNIKEVKA